MVVYFTADLHHLHKNILTMENRPFTTVEEMSEHLIKMWNKQVNPEDEVIIVGDFALSNSYQKIAEIMVQLNGKKTIVRGNHDKVKVLDRLKEAGLIETYHDVGFTMEAEKQHIWVTHYPMQIGLRPRLWSVHGHIHSIPSDDLNQLNVGVDSPLLKHKEFGELVSLEELLTIMRSRGEDIEKVFLEKGEA